MRELASDEKLVGLVQSGDIAAFELLVRRYQTKVHAFIQRRVRSPDVDDIVQETFINLYKSIDRVDVTKPFRSYLFTIARNETVNFFRSRKLHVSIDTMEVESDESIEGQYVKYERHAHILDAIRKLPQKYTDILHAYYIDDLSYKEIATKLVLPINTVRTHLKRAKKKIQEYIHHET